MTGELILVTGGTGMIGFRVLETALEAGYRVRAAVRRAGAIQQLKSIPSLEPYLGALEFAIVPDISLDGAYDEAIEDASYVYHLASPLAVPANDYEASFFGPAVKGTINVLEAAKKQSSVKRVIIASSVAILKAMHGDPAVSIKDVVADSDGPFPHFFVAYQFSKVKAWYATKEWLAKNDHKFEVSQIYPSYVLGRNPLVNDIEKLETEGSSQFLIQFIQGGKVPAPVDGSTVHLDDVATLFLKAIDPSIPGGQNWIANSQDPNGDFEWDQAREIIKDRFPEAVSNGVLSVNGVFPTAKGRGRLDNSGPLQSIPGFFWKSYEDQVVTVAEQVIDVKGKPSNSS
ncbi:hypothetical protein PV08_07227 [Exophiala spinifera]|uniref:NAD-dependent epimerase/dehydratase domain-containing protein n=1 Tax=Exophiala spinifera TaxID=91928 RepID=A0A0D2B6F2_9EURO|nr:uncharacterized protein PV08_07227 [Exophiala spinifera]KIW14443.1 hypothetical protein PV08_07227 [Exophiala spinifera]